jgi:hypothetical protein
MEDHTNLREEIRRNLIYFLPLGYAMLLSHVEVVLIVGIYGDVK